MHPFFSPLSAADLGLLITALNRGEGSRQAALFAYLPPERRALLADKAQALLQIPADKRVPLMVRELRAGLAAGASRNLERVDPSWLVGALKNESAWVVGAVLTALPAPLVRGILRRLPAATVADLPPREALARAPARLLKALVTRLEQRFAPMPGPPEGPWGFFDLVHLDRRDLNALVRDLGLVELGQAFAAVGRMALLDLCRRLPRASAEALVQAVAVAARLETPDLGAAKFFLSQVVVNFDQTEAFVQRAGLWRLAKATAGAEPATLRPLMQRLPARAASIVGELAEKVERPAEPLERATLRARWQDSILVRVVALSRAGSLKPPAGAEPFVFADPQAAERALAATDAPPAP